MKNFAIKLVLFTTAYLFVFTILTQINVPFRLLLVMLVVGQALLLYMVYKVLTDNYTTNKSFKDWYEDKPIKTLGED
jgi:hypothetical protein